MTFDRPLSPASGDAESGVPESNVDESARPPSAGPETVTTTGIAKGEFFSVDPVTTMWPVNVPGVLSAAGFSEAVTATLGSVHVKGKLVMSQGASLATV